MLNRLRSFMTTLWTPLADLLLRRGVSPVSYTHLTLPTIYSV